MTDTPESTSRAKARVEAKYLPGLTLALLMLLALWAILYAVSECIVGDRKAGRRMSEAFGVIQRSYVAEAEAEPLVRGAISGMVASLRDPHCAYLPPTETQLLQQAQRGEIGGIGIEVAFRNRQVVVIAPVEGMPADRAGVRSGDAIVEVDGADCRELDLREVVRMVRGVIGTKVAIALRREGQAEPIRVELERARIEATNVRSEMLDHGIGLVRIIQFSDHVGDDFRDAVEALAAKGLRGLVLDLRFNPGGVVDEAVAVADALLADGVIVRTQSRHEREVTVRRASKDRTLTSVPIVVLVNQGTASASEIVAGALQDHERGVLVGVKTFGKGVVSKTIPLSDGSSLALTVAKYYTPRGRSIEGSGLAPDIDEPAARTPAPRPRDQALRRAVDHLKQRL